MDNASCPVKQGVRDIKSIKILAILHKFGKIDKPNAKETIEVQQF